jgi:RNA polymerase sigma factor (sigma-70 family)
LVTYDSEAIEAADGIVEHAWPDDAAERLSLQQDLQRALLQLPATHRTVLLLIKREGYSYEEAAQRMNLSAATVTSYLHDARARVKLLLERRKGP